MAHLLNYLYPSPVCPRDYLIYEWPLINAIVIIIIIIILIVIILQLKHSLQRDNVSFARKLDRNLHELVKEEDKDVSDPDDDADVDARQRGRQRCECDADEIVTIFGILDS